MGLADIVRSGVAIADSLTATLQVTVNHYVFSEASVDGYGKITWASPHGRKAIVEAKRRLVRTPDGHDVLSSHVVTLPRQVDVDPRDKITFADGTTGPILAVEGVQDAGYSNGKRYLTQVWLG